MHNILFNLPNAKRLSNAGVLQSWLSAFVWVKIFLLNSVFKSALHASILPARLFAK
jgi:hypothetical protein